MATGHWMKEKRVSETIDLPSFFDDYEDLAVEIVDDAESNEAEYCLPYSNRELADMICGAMDWEDFDLFEKQPFEEVYERRDEAELLAYAFISFLRYRLFKAAGEQGIGNALFNQKVMAYSEYWYIRLVEKWNQLSGDAPKIKPWVN